MYDIEKIIDSLMDREEIKIEDIPSIDLYMDQVLSLFDKFFPYNFSEQELTKTMVNNYSKGGIINPAVKKKYNKEHILMIIIICMLKRNISLSEIKKLIEDSKNVFEEKEDKKIDDEKLESKMNFSDEVEKTYRTFLDKKDIMNEKAKSRMKEILSSFEYGEVLNGDNKILDVMILCYYSNILGEAARRIIREEEDL